MLKTRSIDTEQLYNTSKELLVIVEETKPKIFPKKQKRNLNYQGPDTMLMIRRTNILKDKEC